MANTSSQRFEFPLSERYLPRVRVSPEQHAELRAFAVRRAQEVIREGQTWARTNVETSRARGWKVLSQAPDQCFMTKSAPSTEQAVHAVASGGGHRARSSSLGASPMTATGGSLAAVQQLQQVSGPRFMGYARLPGYTLEDAIGSLHCTTTPQHRAQMQRSYGATWLDCCVLATLETATADDPFWYLGLKWTAAKTPLRQLVSHREFAYLEHTGTHVMPNGQRLLYRILQPVSLHDFGGEASYFGLTRAYLESAQVYWMAPSRPSTLAPQPEEEQGVLCVCSKGVLHPRGRVPLWLVQWVLKKIWRAGFRLTAVDANGNELPQLADDLEQPTLTLDAATHWVPNNQRTACFVCHKKFRLGRRHRHHCRACGEVICGGCSQHMQLQPSAVSWSASSRGWKHPPSPSQSHSQLLSPRYDALSATQSRSSSVELEAMTASARAMQERFGGEDTDDGYGGRRQPQASDSLMLGRVCTKCIELKKVTMRREATVLHVPIPGAATASQSHPSSGTAVATAGGSRRQAKSYPQPPTPTQAQTPAQAQTQAQTQAQNQQALRRRQQSAHQERGRGRSLSWGEPMAVLQSSAPVPLSRPLYEDVPMLVLGTEDEEDDAGSDIAYGVPLDSELNDVSALGRGYPTRPTRASTSSTSSSVVEGTPYAMDATVNFPGTQSLASTATWSSQRHGHQEQTRSDRTFRLDRTQELMEEDGHEGGQMHKRMPMPMPMAVNGWSSRSHRENRDFMQIQELTDTGRHSEISLHEMTRFAHRQSDLSVSAFDADALIDTAALRDRQCMVYTPVTGAALEESVDSRIRRMQDEVQQQQQQQQRDGKHYSASWTGKRGAPVSRMSSSASTMSTMSTLSSEGDVFGSASAMSVLSEDASCSWPAPPAAAPERRLGHEEMQSRMESTLADQAYLLYRIQLERERMNQQRRGV